LARCPNRTSLDAPASGLRLLWVAILLAAPAVGEAQTAEVALDLSADRAAEARFDACFEAAQTANPSAFGRVVVVAEPGNDGALGAGKLVEGTLGVAEADRCLEAAMAGTRVNDKSGAQRFRVSRAWVPTKTRPTRQLNATIQACGTGPAEPDVLVAKVDVVLGTPEAVDFQLPLDLPSAQTACIEQALWHQPHRLGTGTRFYEIALGD
jgi:hypothetical protein